MVLQLPVSLVTLSLDLCEPWCDSLHTWFFQASTDALMNTAWHRVWDMRLGLKTG